MLDYVKRSELESERKLRIQAEAALKIADDHLVRLTEMIDMERQMTERERIRHYEEIELLVKHMAPLTEATPELPGLTKPMTLEEALVLPAIGRAQIEAKRNLIAELRRSKANQSGSSSEPATDDGELSEAERQRVSTQIG